VRADIQTADTVAAGPLSGKRRQASAIDCRHCGLPLPRGSRGEYCCDGCLAVSLLLREEGLERYYDLRRGPASPVGALPAMRERAWLEPLAVGVTSASSICRLALDVQGMHCAGCVWLIEELFRRQRDGSEILVNPALGTIDLWVGREFPLARFVDSIERFGYQLGPARKGADARADGLLLRLGICLALAGNSMMLAAAIYFGLDAGPLHQLFVSASWAMAALSVIVGGPVFFRSAWQGLRQRILHLDVPISLGILLAFAGSSWAMVASRSHGIYFDTVSVFIALMLLGRVLQQRVLAANRRRLLADDGIDGILCRRVVKGRVEVVGCRALAEGDQLLVATGDLIPVACTLAEGEAADVSLDWVSGESEPRRFAAGETIPAGAFNAGRTALRLTAGQPFADSALIALLRAPRRSRGDQPGAHASRLARRVSGIYVTLTLAAALGGLCAWWLAGDAARGIEVAIAVLVVTCPCAFGIALPLAHELFQAGLRRQGLFVRTADFADRARSVRRIVFDKTGTLTTGRLELRASDGTAALARLSAADRTALYDLAAQSNHPRSQAVRRALEEGGRVSLDSGVAVHEQPGAGIEAEIRGFRYRLGAPWWVTDGALDNRPAGADLGFSIDGAPLAWFATYEAMRPDATNELGELARAGYELWILSGDQPERVAAAAAELGLDPARALGSMTPDGKAAWLAAHDRGDTLFLGDGINDGLAADDATCSGTPAIDRPFMATRSDFYLTTAGLAPIGRALAAAHRLARVARRNLVFTTSYNAAAVALCWAGLMRPWLAAVLMPASSIVVVAMTIRALSHRRLLWRS
jgi:Cu2+-exporting ATPase